MKVRQWLRSLIGTVSSSDINYKYVIKIMIAGLLAVAFSYLVNLNLLGCMMVVVYAVLIVQANIGATLSTLKPVIFWILSGTLLGLIVLLILGSSLQIHPDLIWVIVAFFVVIASFVVPISSMARLGLVTAIIVLVYGEAMQAPLVAAMTRGFYLLMAVFIGLGVTYLVFPQQAGHIMLDNIRDFQNDCLDIFREISNYCFFDDQGEWDKEPVIERAANLRSSIRTITDMVDHVKREGKYSDDFFRSIIVAENRIVTFLCDFARMATVVKTNEIFLLSRKPMHQLVRAVEIIMKNWLCIVEEKPMHESWPDVKKLCANIEDSLSQYRDVMRLQSVQQLTAFFGFFNLLQMFAYRMVDAVERAQKVIAQPKPKKKQSQLSQWF